MHAGSNNTKARARAAGAAAPAPAAASAAAPQHTSRDPREWAAGHTATDSRGAPAPAGARSEAAGGAATPAEDAAAREGAPKKHGGIPYKLLAVTAMLAREGCEGTALQVRARRLQPQLASGAGRPG